MRKNIGYYAALAALLLAGAGCEGAVRQEAELGAPEPESATLRQDDAAEDESDIDASVDAIIGAGEDEKEAQDDKESDADEVGADDASINAYGDASYETK